MVVLQVLWVRRDHMAHTQIQIPKVCTQVHILLGRSVVSQVTVLVLLPMLMVLKHGMHQPATQSTRTMVMVMLVHTIQQHGMRHERRVALVMLLHIHTMQLQWMHLKQSGTLVVILVLTRSAQPRGVPRMPGVLGLWPYLRVRRLLTSQWSDLPGVGLETGRGHLLSSPLGAAAPLPCRSMLVKPMLQHRSNQALTVLLRPPSTRALTVLLLLLLLAARQVRRLLLTQLLLWSTMLTARKPPWGLAVMYRLLLQSSLQPARQLLQPTLQLP